MIPAFDFSGVLPPYTGSAQAIDGRSPYPVSLREVHERLATSPARKELFDGLLRYREALRGFGIVDGFQWLDGSFVEDVERTENRCPRDIDVVTFACRPRHLRRDEAWWTAMDERGDLFAAHRTKLMFRCDAYCIDLDARSLWLMRQITYWHGLFSHRRESNRWKGMLQVDLVDSGELALATKGLNSE